MSRSRFEPQPDHTADEPAPRIEPIADPTPPSPPDPAPEPLSQTGLLALLGEMLTVLEIAVSHIPAAHNVGPRLVAARAALTALAPPPPLAG